MMGIALTMARWGLGTTAPNPSVGAVIVDPATGEVVSRGTTAAGGRPHAEPIAIARAGGRARGATIYVTLEPCSHHGRTPPCAEAVIAAGIGRCVVGIEDPDPRVAGRGLDLLRRAGIAVTRGVRAAEAHGLTIGHVTRVTQRRPFVQLKLALGADGDVPRGAGGRAVFVTSPEARAYGHLLRAETDAILVGRGTVLADDPELTCRLPGLDYRSPQRVVLAGDGIDLSGSRLLAAAGAAPILMFTRSGVSVPATAGVRAFGVPAVGDGLWLPSVLETLAAEGVTRLLVEGGPRVWRAFAQAGLVDEVVLFLAGGDGDPLALVRRHLGALPLVVAGARQRGPDRVWHLKADASRPAGPARWSQLL